jgi:hypothetical protein
VGSTEPCPLDLMECSQASSHSAFRLHAPFSPKTGLELDQPSQLHMHQDCGFGFTSSRPFHVSQELSLYACFLGYTNESVKERLQQGWLFYHRGDGGRGQRLAHDLRPREARHEPCGLQIAFFDPENRAFVRLWRPNSKGIRSNHRGPVSRHS